MTTLKEALDQLAKGHKLDNEHKKLIIDKWQKELGIQREDCISRQAVLDATVKRNSIWNKITNSKGENLEEIISQLPSVTPQPDTARRIVGKSRGGMTLWYQCEKCNEPVDERDTFCRGCGRRLVE